MACSWRHLGSPRSAFPVPAQFRIIGRSVNCAPPRLRPRTPLTLPSRRTDGDGSTAGLGDTDESVGREEEEALVSRDLASTLPSKTGCASDGGRASDAPEHPASRASRAIEAEHRDHERAREGDPNHERWKRYATGALGSDGRLSSNQKWLIITRSVQ